MAPHPSPDLRRPRSLIVAIALAASGCAHFGRPAQAADAEVRAAIAAGNAEFARALVAGDAHAAAAVFTADGEVIPTARRGFIKGREEIAAYNASRLATRRYLDLVLTTVDVEVSGDLAWETGTNSITVQQGEAAPVTLTGRYLVVWKREQDGRWRIRVDLPISDPLP